MGVWVYFSGILGKIKNLWEKLPFLGDIWPISSGFVGKELTLGWGGSGCQLGPRQNKDFV